MSQNLKQASRQMLETGMRNDYLQEVDVTTYPMITFGETNAAKRLQHREDQFLILAADRIKLWIRHWSPNGLK